MKRILLLILLLSATGCRKWIEFTTSIPTDNSFVVAAPGEQEVANYRRAAAYSKEHDGAAVLVIKNDKIVFEQYQNGYQPEQPHHIYSGTKSFAGIMAIAAVADNIISLDEKISDTIIEFSKDPLKSKITVRHLLNFTSGIEQNFFRLSWDGMMERQNIIDKYTYALGLDVETEPGRSYQYGSSHLMVFGEFMKRKLKQNPLDYLQKRIFKPIGFRYGGWHKDPSGNPMLPYGTWTTAREWAKFGILMRDRGKWQGKQILPAELVEQCFVGSEVMPAYGLTFWLNNQISEKSLNMLGGSLRRIFVEHLKLYPPGSNDMVVAAGHNDNRLYICPSNGMVVVRLGFGDRDYSDAKFISLVLNQSLPKGSNLR